MKAMILKKIWDFSQNSTPLVLAIIPNPIPQEGEILIQVCACGVCHTELDEIEGRTPPPRFPVILGHQIVGRVVSYGSRSSSFQIGERVGVAWIYSSCGRCKFCLEGNENLCPDFQATGRDANGGYAEYMVAPEGFAYHIPEVYTDVEAAPLLCAGAIGYRSLRLAGLQNGQKLGLTGFGASAHIILKLVRFHYPNAKVYVFSRSEQERGFAVELGATWAGKIDDPSPEKLDCIIDTTPVWKPITEGLRNLAPGGRLVINAIRKEEVDKGVLLELNYPSQLWMEKEIKTVANVSRRDVIEFLELASKIPIRPEVTEFALEQANQALLELKSQKIRGAKVLRIH